MDRGSVSFMSSYPNDRLLPAATVRRIVERPEPHPFQHVDGAWLGAVLRNDGKAALRRPAERYLRALEVEDGR